MPRGASAKREHEYEELVDEFEDQGRYKGREQEVASRIVNKQRAQHGETQEDKHDDKTGHSPDKNLPLPHYDTLTVEQIVAKLDGLKPEQIKKIQAYEQHHNGRKTLLEQIHRRLDK